MNTNLKHILTVEDLKVNPELYDAGFSVGDIVYLNDIFVMDEVDDEEIPSTMSININGVTKFLA